MIFGKQISGPKSIIPHSFIWGGCVWLFVWDRSAILRIPDVVCDFLQMVGFDPYDR